MKERPILFSGEMVRTILVDAKTQTRRVAKFPGGKIDTDKLPYGNAGDRLWVRETWCRTEDGGYAFAADEWASHPSPDEKWRPSIFMPREACRLQLDITAIRLEKLRDISQADAVAEGVGGAHAQAQLLYRALWDKLNAKRGYGWAKNPYVWVIEFRRVTP